MHYTYIDWTSHFDLIVGGSSVNEIAMTIRTCLFTHAEIFSFHAKTLRFQISHPNRLEVHAAFELECLSYQR